MRAKIVIAIQLALIIILLGLLWYQHSSSEINKEGLLSPRVYTGIIEPKSYLILNFVPLKQELQKYIGNHNLTMSVYLVNLRAGTSMSIDSYRSFAPASLSKVPVAILMMRKVEEGKWDLDTPLEIKDQDRDSSSGDLYNTTEKFLPVGVLIHNMLQHSDNTAFKVFLRYLDQEDQQVLSSYWDYFSADGILQAGSKSQENLITPRSMYNIFASLYLSTMLEPEHSEFILQSLINTDFDVNKKAQLPAEVRVAHKFGVREDDKTTVFHDCGIMYLQDMRFFYCVMSKGTEQKKAVEHTGYVVHEIYNYIVTSRKDLDQFKENH